MRKTHSHHLLFRSDESIFFEAKSLSFSLVCFIKVGLISIIELGAVKQATNMYEISDSPPLICRLPQHRL